MLPCSGNCRYFRLSASTLPFDVYVISMDGEAERLAAFQKSYEASGARVLFVVAFCWLLLPPQQPLVPADLLLLSPATRTMFGPTPLLLLVLQQMCVAVPWRPACGFSCATPHSAAAAAPGHHAHFTTLHTLRIRLQT